MLKSRLTMQKVILGILLSRILSPSRKYLESQVSNPEHNLLPSSFYKENHVGPRDTNILHPGGPADSIPHKAVTAGNSKGMEK